MRSLYPFLGLSVCATVGINAQERPNFLIIQCDQFA